MKFVCRIFDLYLAGSVIGVKIDVHLTGWDLMFLWRSCRRFSSYGMWHCVLGAGRWLQSTAWPWEKRHYGYSKRQGLLSQRHSSVTCQDMTSCRDLDFLFLQTGRKARSSGVAWPCFGARGGSSHWPPLKRLWILSVTVIYWISRCLVQ